MRELDGLDKSANGSRAADSDNLPSVGQETASDIRHETRG